MLDKKKSYNHAADCTQNQSVSNNCHENRQAMLQKYSLNKKFKYFTHNIQNVMCLQFV